MEVRFEDLVLHTERELRRICEHIEIDFHPNMLGYHETAEERLQEKARELSRGAGRDPQSAERRLKSHEKTFKPPNPEMIGTWKRRMPRADRAGLRGACRRHARGARLRARHGGRRATRRRQGRPGARRGVIEPRYFSALLRQPGGFEGFVLSDVVADPEHSPLAELDHAVKVDLDRGAAAPSRCRAFAH